MNDFINDHLNIMNGLEYIMNGLEYIMNKYNNVTIIFIKNIGI